MLPPVFTSVLYSITAIGYSRGYQEKLNSKGTAFGVVMCAGTILLEVLLLGARDGKKDKHPVTSNRAVQVNNNRTVQKNVNNTNSRA
ncbi:hypothetical protein Ddc_22473 [Ditylenchus destructor]|nr:hypothetical protein Ddc_22473 [Ditylenchus destructor]